MIKITVSASKEYDVVMERGALSGIPALMEEAGIIPGKKLCIVADETTNRLFGGESCDLWQTLTGAGFDMYRYVFEGGEKSKTMNRIEVMDMLRKKLKLMEFLLCLIFFIAGILHSIVDVTELKSL